MEHSGYGAGSVSSNCCFYTLPPGSSCFMKPSLAYSASGRVSVVRLVAANTGRINGSTIQTDLVSVWRHVFFFFSRNRSVPQGEVISARTTALALRAAGRGGVRERYGGVYCDFQKHGGNHLSFYSPSAGLAGQRAVWLFAIEIILLLLLYAPKYHPWWDLARQVDV